MKKRLLSALLALCLALALLPLPALAANSDFVIRNGVLEKYNGPGGNVVIPSGVTSIGEYAFVGCENLTSVTIPSGVTSIGKGAFELCYSLSSITIPNSVTSIGDWAFAWCDNLTTGVTIPYSVTSIGWGAFSGCTSLADIKVLSGNAVYSDIGGVLFDKTGKALLAFPGGRHGHYSIPSGVASIGTLAFADCKNLTSVTIPYSVTSIGESAFLRCISLESVTIPDSVTYIGGGAFSGCERLKNVTIPNGVTSLVDGDYEGSDGTFEGCSGLTSVTISNAVTSIGDFTFSYCSSLKSVSIPNSVTRIGYDAFSYCGSLESVSIPNSVTIINSSAFINCSSLKSVIIPNSVTSIGEYTFAYCSDLTSVTIPRGVTNIGDCAFYDCDSLTDVYYGGTEAQWKRIKIGDDNSDLFNAAIHYNSAGLNQVELPFYSGLGNKTNFISVDWGWSLFEGSALTSEAYKTYDNRLAVTGLALSAASEQSKSRAEELLDQLGFENIVSANYNQPPYIIAQPGVTFGHKCVIASGKEQHIFAAVVRGTTNIADIMTDVFSLAGAFQVSGQNVYDLLTAYIRDTCHLAPDNIRGNTRFFVTGHSLGGATCNVLAKKLNESYGAKNVFAYTFASPTTAFSGSDTGERGNIYNILNNEDVVPLVPPTLWARYGLPMWFSRNDYTEMYQHFADLTGGKDLRSVMDSIWLWDELSKIGYAHATETYMSFLLALSDDASLINHFSGGASSGISGGGAWCPVDLDIYVETDRGSKLVGRIRDNVIDESVTTGIILRVDGDRKYFYFPVPGDYTIEMTGTGTDTMTYFVQDMNAETGEPVPGTGTVFQNVSLTPGKQFSSEVNVVQETAANAGEDVALYVLGEDSKPEKEVLPDGKGTEIPYEPKPGQIPFDDVEAGKWYYDAVYWAVQKGVTNGTGPATFSPDQDCTEIQILTFLWRAAGKPAADAALPVTVTGVADYVSAAKWAFSKGMIDASFKQNSPCTRARAVMLMWQAAGSPAASGGGFADVPANADYAQAVSWAVQKGVTNGTGGNMFSPDGICSRGHIVTFLYRDRG